MSINMSKTVTNLAKPGDKINVTKSNVIVATTTWRRDKDYDIAADVVYTDGRVVTVVTYGTTEHPHSARLFTDDMGVVHAGDVKAGGNEPKREVISVGLKPNVRAVVIWGYSAQKNGTGSFREYEVSLSIDTGSEVIQMLPKDMSDNPGVYTLVLGTIHNTEKGVFVEKNELYSRGGERRPKVTYDQKRDRVDIEVDKGETNLYKN